MQAFTDLTATGQVRRLRRLAKAALTKFGIDYKKFSLIQHGENATFRVDTLSNAGSHADAAFVEGRYVLRIHRPAYHSKQQLQSELLWLAALQRDTDLVIPEPMASTAGNYLVDATAPGIPGPRFCSLLRWIRGRFSGSKYKPHHFRAAGKLMACLHRHSVGWQQPAEFSRRHWDEEGLFGDQSGYHLPARQVWQLLPHGYASTFKTIAEKAISVMQQMGKDSGVFGLIHGDLHMGNLLFSGGQARAIDFDDCGFGYWIYDFAVALCEYRDKPDWI